MRDLKQDFAMGVTTKLCHNFREWRPKSPPVCDGWGCPCIVSFRSKYVAGGNVLEGQKLPLLQVLGAGPKSLLLLFKSQSKHFCWGPNHDTFSIRGSIAHPNPLQLHA